MLTPLSSLSLCSQALLTACLEAAAQCLRSFRCPTWSCRFSCANLVVSLEDVLEDVSPPAQLQELLRESEKADAVACREQLVSMVSHGKLC